LGCDPKEQYRKIYPKISLPFQIVERISFGHKDVDPNKLYFGDNLHIMRSLPSNLIDLIYIDPPFFSGKTYNVVFGDQNEVRSFTDIWEGGMPGYLTWLNARLLEMKRLLKPSGSIFVNLDWHAAHYVKVELDKIFGYENFLNEIIWCYSTSGRTKKWFSKKHQTILVYGKTKEPYWNDKEARIPYSAEYIESHFRDTDEKGSKIRKRFDAGKWRVYYPEEGMIPNDWWEIPYENSMSKDRIGYPTQKPDDLLRRIIKSASKSGDLVADFFCGGGTTPVVAYQENRRWLASDISKIAVSVTRDRLLRAVVGNTAATEKIQNSLGIKPDMIVAHWGIYEVPEIVKMNTETFKQFIIEAYNGRLSTSEGLIHGYKQSTPIFVGKPSQEEQITEKEVIAFAKHIVKAKGHHQGIMIAWGFTSEAKNAAEQLKAQHALSLDFVKIELVPIESNEFREHVTSRHPEYRNLLKFILPPEVRINTKRINALEYEFDVSESVSLNPLGKIINVQWDFSYNGERFISTSGYSFLGMKNNKPVLKANYKFDTNGRKRIACKVQDDEGGEKIEIIEIDAK
jgi:site-specific DNA-methyltransferase (adenine-specific)/adenine-specific DNA-methyltransferase